MFSDYFLDGSGHGDVADVLAHNVDYDPYLLRPYKDENGHICVTCNTGKRVYNKKTRRMEPVFEKRLVRDLIHNLDLPFPVTNATTLRKDEWIELDRVVVRAARSRLRAWSDLLSRSSFGGFNAMSKMILEHETMSDPGAAHVDMDALTGGQTNDGPKFQLEGLPLPITHSDFWFSRRRLLVSRNTGTPLDSTMAEASARRVAETIEQTLIGTLTGTTYGVAANYNNAPTVYGYLTHPDRLTYTTLTTPNGSNGSTTVDEVLAMVEDLNDANFYGPFMLYHSTDWDKFLDDDYRAQDTRTLRQRLRQIESIQDVRRLDFLTSTNNPYTMILVQMTQEVARAINGMDITTVRWESQGGMRLNFKVMAIQVPQLRSDFNGNMGLLVGTTS